MANVFGRSSKIVLLAHQAMCEASIGRLWVGFGDGGYLRQFLTPLFHLAPHMQLSEGGCAQSSSKM